MPVPRAWVHAHMHARMRPHPAICPCPWRTHARPHATPTHARPHTPPPRPLPLHMTHHTGLVAPTVQLPSAGVLAARAPPVVVLLALHRRGVPRGGAYPAERSDGGAAGPRHGREGAVGADGRAGPHARRARRRRRLVLLQEAAAGDAANLATGRRGRLLRGGRRGGVVRAKAG
eukprot:363089-Chlamydomonas_euryale.AAC.8